MTNNNPRVKNMFYMNGAQIYQLAQFIVPDPDDDAQMNTDATICEYDDGSMYVWFTNYQYEGAEELYDNAVDARAHDNNLYRRGKLRRRMVVAEFLAWTAFVVVCTTVVITRLF